jgi:hypothetical protein
VHLERPQRVLIVGGHEHDQRQVPWTGLLDDVEAAEAGHLHVEQDDVGTQRLDRTHRGNAVARLSDHVDVRHRAQHQPQAVARERLVVHDQGADSGCHGSLSVSCVFILRSPWLTQVLRHTPVQKPNRR